MVLRLVGNGFLNGSYRVASLTKPPAQINFPMPTKAGAQFTVSR
jgi:hypothetical protein